MCIPLIFDHRHQLFVHECELCDVAKRVRKKYINKQKCHDDYRNFHTTMDSQFFAVHILFFGMSNGKKNPIFG